MTDSDISQWIGLASLAIPVLVWLSIALVVRRALGRFGLQGGGSLLGRWFPKWRWVMRVLVSLFTGLMIATAVGAVFPRAILPAASLICDGSVELLSRGYSYKPGQSGVSHLISCIAADGSRTSITLATVGVAFLLYSAAVFVLLLLWHLVSGGIARQDDGAQDFRMPGATMPSGPSFTGSPLGSADGPHGFTSTRTTVSVDDAVKLQGLAGLSHALRQTLGGKVAEMVEEALEQARHPPRDGGPIVIDGGTRIIQGGEPDTASRLRALQALRDQGLISSAEYEAKRADILGSL